MTHPTPSTQMEYSVCFRLSAEWLDPNAVTAALGIVPTHSHTAGEKYRVSRGEGRSPAELEYKVGVWYVDSGVQSRASLDDHLRQITRWLRYCSAEVASFVAKGGKAEMVVGVFVSGQGGGILSADVMREIGEMGIDIDFDFHPLSSQ